MTTVTERPVITGHRMSRNRHREPVCSITLVGEHVIGRFLNRMAQHQSEFHRLAERIHKAPPRTLQWAEDNEIDGYRKFYDDHNQVVVVITLVGWHSIHRLAYNMRTWQVEFCAMGHAILKSQRRALGRDEWRRWWVIYHGTEEKPMTFYWGRDI